MVLNPGEVHVWFVRTDRVVDPDVLEQYEATLSAGERARRDRFVFEKDRHQFLVTRGVLRALLARYLKADPRECEFVTNSHGRPSLLPVAPGRTIEFNLSHTTGLLAIALAHTPEVGIDVEHVERTVGSEDLPRRYFSTAEVEALERMPAEARKAAFFDFWTLKEAYIKARGLGLSLPLDGFSIHLDPDGPPRISFASTIPDDAASWQFAQFRPSPTHRMALAVRRRGPDLRVLVRELLDGTL
jgi:4'-phosphopantetheinyl transferase